MREVASTLNIIKHDVDVCDDGPETGGADDESAGAVGGCVMRGVQVSRFDQHRLESDVEIPSANLRLLQQYIKRTTCTTRAPIYMS